MKICVLSDLHLGAKPYGLKEREDDFYNEFLKIQKEIINESPDILLICGDSFDMAKPSPQALYNYKLMTDLFKENNILIFFIVGNHTTLRSVGHVVPERIFLDKNHRELNSDNSPYVIGDIAIYGIEYCGSYQKDFLKDILDKYKKECDNHKFNILMLHQAISPYCGPFGVDLNIDEISDSFDIILNGHIHDRIIDKRKNNIFCQPGSLERLSISEHKGHISNGKGYIIIEINNEEINIIPKDIILDRVFIPYDINLEKETLEDSFNEIFNVIDNNNIIDPLVFVRIVGKDINLQLVYDYKSKLEEKCLYCKFDIEDTKNIADISYDNLSETDLLNPLRIMKDYCNELGFNEAQEKLLYDIYHSANNKEEMEKIVDDFYENNY